MGRSTMTKTRLLEFAGCWGRQDIDALMELFTPDCVYKASVGDEPGTTFVGREEVRTGVLKMFAHDQGSTSHITRIELMGDVGFSEWTYTFPDGHVVYGCDLFEFRNDQVRVKNAFRKTQR